ncbi:hypothetical protein PflCFBP13517_23030 [Pseudomonas fluorescens]|nr:hypothetical protein PflCFBP13517_23030 [Pseudomonas fluorescens]
MLEILKRSYLAGAVTTQNLEKLAKLIKLKTSSTSPVLNYKIEDIIASMAREFYITRHLDNFYGRLFETELAQHIIHNPSPEMVIAKKIITNVIKEHFQNLAPCLQVEMCLIIDGKLREDIGPWAESIAEIKNFMATNTPEDFIAMLNCDHIYSIPLTLSIAINYIVRAGGFKCSRNPANTPYFNTYLPQRDTLYNDIITPQRAMERVVNDKEKSNRHGIMLHYQHGENKIQNKLGVGIRPIDQYRISTTTVSEHNQQAFSIERAIGVGMSGCSNVLNFLYLDIEKNFPDFSIENARLMTAAHLTFSGGHSFNEAYTVFSYQNNKSFKPICFNELQEKNQLARMAIDHAYNHIINTSISFQ